jgi:hypothetical protein
MPLTVHCPKCGEIDIREKNIAVANLAVLGWEWDAEAEEVRPTDYDTDESADWEAADGPNIYVCYGCEWEGDLSDLAVRGGLS